MNNTSTPETDALIRGMHEDVSIEGATVANINVFIEHARKLERERDEARATCAQIDLSHRQLESERDQLRKVCDEWAYYADHDRSQDQWMKIVTAYNSLTSSRRKKSTIEWAELLGINVKTIRSRLNYGWPVERVLTK